MSSDRPTVRVSDLQIGDRVPIAAWRGDPGSTTATVVKVLPIPIPPCVRVTFDDGHIEDYPRHAEVQVVAGLVRMETADA